MLIDEIYLRYIRERMRERDERETRERRERDERERGERQEREETERCISGLTSESKVPWSCSGRHMLHFSEFSIKTGN